MQTIQLSTGQKIRDYYNVTKPNVISLLVFTAAASYVAAAGRTFSVLTLAVIAGAVWLGSAAANTIGSYFDRDIDVIMQRTRKRPIPSGEIRPQRAAAYGIMLLIASLALSVYFLSLQSALAMLVGFLDYVVVYSFLLKRRSPANILLGGFSGVMPVLVAYYATRTPVISLLTAIFVGFLVFFWIPEHIWSLALRYKKDYEAARVPMLTVVMSEKNSVRVIALTSILMVAYSLLPLAYPEIGLGTIYIVTASILGAGVIAFNIWLLKKPTPERAWAVFKFSSPYLMLAFIGIVADILVTHH